MFRKPVWGTLTLSVLALMAPVRGGREFRRLTTLDGLSHNTVHAILQDSDGFLWLGTRDGLDRYDGYDFLVYRSDPRKVDTLPHNSVTALSLGEPGRIWAGTEAGLARFDLRTQAFRRFEMPDGGKPPTIHSLFRDHEGRLWVGTSRGLFSLLPNSETVVPVREGTGTGPIFSIFESASRTLWCLADTGLVPCLGSSEAGAGVAPGIGPGILFDPRGPAPLPDDSPRLPVEAFADSGQALWFGAADGLYLWERNQRELKAVSLGVGTALERYVRALYLDAAGGLWVGTQGGLFYSPAYPRAFRRERLVGKTETPAPVSSIAESSEGGFWVGTYGHGLKRINREGTLVESYGGAEDSRVALGDSWIWSVVEDPWKTVWLATGRGVRRLEKGGRLTSVDWPGGRATVAHNLAIGRGSVWFLTRTHLVRLQQDGWRRTWTQFPLSSEDRRIPPYEVLVEDPEKQVLWLGGERLTRLDLATGQLREVPLQHDGRPIPKPQIVDLHVRGDDLWIGSVLGLFRFDTNSGDIAHYTVEDGLPASIVYSIESDSSGALWLGTNRGICRFDPLSTNDRFTTYGPRDGTGGLEFNRNASLAANDGTLLFGGLEGLTIFDPRDVGASPGPPPIALTAIEHSSREDSTRVNPWDLKSLTLPYTEYTVRFTYAALSFPNPAKQRYRYRLEPLERNWIDAGTRRFVQYTNLAPGRYRFNVLGANEAGEWNLQGASLELVVTPPYWQTWWFRLLVLAAIAGAVFAAHRYRLRRMLELQRLRLRIAEDLHDHLSTDLSGIAIASNLVGRKTDLDETDRALLARVESTARKSVEAVRDMVWYVSPEHDDFSSLAARMKAEAASLLGQLEWEYENQGIDRMPIPMRLRRDLLPAYKEILHNVVRHADATRVHIRLASDRGELSLSIRDDGVGFQPERVSGGNGLAILRRRAERIGAKLVVESSQGKGTHVQLSIPLPKTRDFRDA